MIIHVRNFFIMSKSIKQNNKKGFTLIEVIVSVGLFAVVVTITLSSILTITDSNKKARSLMSVMTNLNFAVDSITRSFKTGVLDDGTSPIASPVTNNGKCLSTYEIDYGGGTNFSNREVTYCFVEKTLTAPGKIQKDVGFGPVDLTSPDVNIDYMKFTSSNTAIGSQPLVNIFIEGTVKANEKISSKFSIQTSVSQRKLNI